ncbi:MAG TPA: hypothetical protein VGL74_08120 [Terriglobales bacterium]
MSRRSGIQIAWKTVTYRSVMLMVTAALAALVMGANFAFPEFTQNTMKAASNTFTNLMERLAGSGETGKTGSQISQQAHITALDGSVRVKKASSDSWVRADYSVPLEKGDVIQTGPEGMAKIVFNDGTNYTVKQDSLIVIEENSANERQQTNVSVNVNTGTVDLATGTYLQGSKSTVVMDGATASLAPDSSARVRKDPKAEQDEFLITKGNGTVERNGQTLQLSDWEKARFKPNSQHLEKVKEIGPPTPISPANMMPIFAGGGESKPIEFSWTPMVNAKGYRLQVSRNPYFSSLVVDRNVTSSAVMVSGLDEGPYYWMVQSSDGGGKQSVESEKNRFTIIAKEADAGAIPLDLDPLIQHGHVIELTGKTEVGARVMVNGHEVPVIGQDGSFHYFMPPMPTGESVITITAQNSKGGVNTQQEKVVIQ